MAEKQKVKGRPKSDSEPLTNVRFSKRLAGIAYVLAKAKGISMAEVLATACEPTLSREFAKYMREFEAKGGK